MKKKIKIFALGNPQFGQEICDYLDIPLSKHQEYRFEDGEAYCAVEPTLKENVRGHHVFVVQNTYTDEVESIDQKLMKLFIFLGALRDASVKKATVVIPFFPYSRSDRKIISRSPITTKYLARILQSLWVDRILTIDIHSPTSVQNAYSIPVDLLEAGNLFAYDLHQDLKHSDLVVVSPDMSGMSRSRRFRESLSKLTRQDIGLACMDKIHEGKLIKGNEVIGDVKNKTVLIYDDMISSGKTIYECTSACMDRGSKTVFAACASHGLFVGNANENLSNRHIEKIVVTDTVRPFRLKDSIKNKLRIIKTTHLFAEAIKRIISNESISDLITNHFPK